MTRPRSELVCAEDTPYYHCISRCVRQSFLCGKDKASGNDYSHRKGWIVARLKILAEVFTIDLCAYAVMANHYHLVVHLNPAAAKALSEVDVAQRWGKLFTIQKPVLSYLAGDSASEEAQAAKAQIASWRAHLADLSWYMKCLNEYLAKKANAEDDIKGRFWEGRFKSQAIVDEAGLLTCMTYVDLNPLRAGIVDTPEASADISLQQRLRQFAQQTEPANQTEQEDTSNQAAPSNIEPSDRPKLLPFADQAAPEASNVIAFALADYLELVDWAGRIHRPDKQGQIAQNAPPILERLGLDSSIFLKAIGKQQLSQGTVIGLAENCQHHAELKGRCRLKGPTLSAA